MMRIPLEKDVVDKLVVWGTAHPLICAMILTSSRTRPDGPVDPLSDDDLPLAVSDVGAFAFDDAWISAYGRPMVRFGDQVELHALATYFRGVVYQNSVKIDYSLWPVELLERIEASAHLADRLDVGYRVLLDKDQRTAGWKQHNSASSGRSRPKASREFLQEPRVVLGGASPAYFTPFESQTSLTSSPVSLALHEPGGYPPQPNESGPFRSSTTRNS